MPGIRTLVVIGVACRIAITYDIQLVLPPAFPVVSAVKQAVDQVLPSFGGIVLKILKCFIRCRWQTSKVIESSSQESPFGSKRSRLESGIV